MITVAVELKINLFQTICGTRIIKSYQNEGFRVIAERGTKSPIKIKDLK